VLFYRGLVVGLNIVQQLQAKDVCDTGRSRCGLLTAAAAGLSVSLCLADAQAQQPAVSSLSQQQVLDIQPLEAAKGIAEGRYLLVDVRELDEIATEAYPDAIALPLSRFDPRQIKASAGQQVVFACRTGRRSTSASLAVQKKCRLRL
jgi:rhodanese-related sulfurtransferase